MVQSVGFISSELMSLSTKVMVGMVDSDSDFQFPPLKAHHSDRAHLTPLSSIDPNRTITNSQLVQHAVSYAKSSRRVSESSSSRAATIFSSKVGTHQYRYSASNITDVTQTGILSSAMSPGSLRRFERGTREQQLQLPASPDSLSSAIGRRRKSDPRPLPDSFLKLKVKGADASLGKLASEDSESDDDTLSSEHLVDNALRLRARVENQQLLQQLSSRYHGRRAQFISTAVTAMPPGCEIEELENFVEECESRMSNRYSELLSNPRRANLLVYLIISGLNLVLWGLFHIMPSMKYHCCLDKTACCGVSNVNHQAARATDPGYVFRKCLSKKIGVFHKISPKHLTSMVIVAVLWARHIALVSYVTVVLVKDGPVLRDRS
ncbi:hypothetical protein V1525DRAFT_409931 [Lipomyces kononenkoae]|uniref:Uncharacterized protein n=1 Tax=Lipomyces kononenkoae TaxID=34357 RepID=A0ACC3SV06_LIPKO